MKIEDFVSGKFADISECGTFVVIITYDFIAADLTSRLDRTVYQVDPRSCLEEAKHGTITRRTKPDRNDRYIGVRLEDLKKILPDWAITKDELLAQYERMQQGRDYPLRQEYMDLARHLWSEKLRGIVKASKKSDEGKILTIVSEGNLATDLDP